MHISEIHPDFRRVTKRVPYFPYSSPFWQPVLQWLYRVAFKTPVVDGVDVRDESFGSVRVRIYVPRRNRSGTGMLWVHGGGMIVGTQVQDNRLCSTYARDLGMVVVSVGYRLAPQHPYPAANDDCMSAWQWMLEHAEELEIDPARIVVASESGGGSHGASLVHRIHDEGGVQPAGQVLFEPMLDDRTAADPALDEGHFIWRWKDNRGGWRAYLGTEPGAPDLPRYAVPARRNDLSGLPPAWIGFGDKDLFYGECTRYAQRLRSAGVEVDEVTVPGAPHGFHLIAPTAPSTQRFMDANHRWLRRVLGIENPWSDGA